MLAWWIWIYPSKSQWQVAVAYLNVSSWNHEEILNLKRYLFTHITFMPFEWIHGNQFVNINSAIPLTSKVNSIRCKHLFYIATWLDLFCIWKHFKTFLHFLFCVSGLWLVIAHLLPAVSALHPYPLCTGLCSSLFYLSLTHLEWWHSYSLFCAYFKARGGVSKEGICLLTATTNSLQFFLFPARWLVCFDKNEYFCLDIGQICQERDSSVWLGSRKWWNGFGKDFMIILLLTSFWKVIR